MSEERDVLKLVCQKLEQANIPYMLKDSLSEMQIRDIRNLLESVKNLNTDYMSEWVRTLHLDQLFERVLSNE